MTSYGTIKAVYSLALPMVLTAFIGIFSLLVNTRILAEADGSYLYILAIHVPFSIFIIALLESFQAVGFAFAGEAKGTKDKGLLWRRFGLLMIIIVVVLAVTAGLILGLGDHFLTAINVDPAKATIIKYFILASTASAVLMLTAAVLSVPCYVNGIGLKVNAINISTTILGFVITWYASHKLGWGVYSLIAAQICTTLISLSFYVLLISRLKIFEVSALKWTELKANFKRFVSIAFPVCTSFVIIIFQSSVLNSVFANYSTELVVGYGIVYRLQNLIILPGIAIGIALAIKVNEGRGLGFGSAQVFDMLREVFLSLFALYGVLALTFYLFRTSIVGLITPDPQIISQAASYLSIVAPSYLVFGPLLCLLIMQEQIGKGLRSLIYNIVSIGLQLAVVIYLASTGVPKETLFLTISAAGGLSIFYLLYELSCYRKQKPPLAVSPTQKSQRTV
ncbi:MAG: hypothetical protein JKY34_16450 [Kordiimonadaceae bacterium]|nr:hypothetical protein [Kordiimonadaceae bacterium]